MFKINRPDFADVITEFRNRGNRVPHCDQRVLHAPGQCIYCDATPDWQALRVLWGIAFTGYQPDVEKHELPCPADHARGDLHTKWGGNIARPAPIDGFPPAKRNSNE